MRLCLGTIFSARKALENRVDVDHDRCGELEQKLREAQALLAETENKSDEVSFVQNTIFSSCVCSHLNSLFTFIFSHFIHSATVLNCVHVFEHSQIVYFEKLSQNFGKQSGRMGCYHRFASYCIVMLELTPSFTVVDHISCVPQDCIVYKLEVSKFPVVFQSSFYSKIIISFFTKAFNCKQKGLHVSYHYFWLPCN